MPNHFAGPGFGGPDPLWMTFISSGVVMVFWIAMLSLVLWVVYQWTRASAGTQRPQPVIAPSGLTAVELLRRRYVLGEIDAAAFEDMLERIVASEVSYEVAQQMLDPRDSGAEDAFYEYRRMLGE